MPFNDWPITHKLQLLYNPNMNAIACIRKAHSHSLSSCVTFRGGISTHYRLSYPHDTITLCFFVIWQGLAGARGDAGAVGPDGPEVSNATHWFMLNVNDDHLSKFFSGQFDPLDLEICNLKDRLILFTWCFCPLGLESRIQLCPFWRPW